MSYKYIIGVDPGTNTGIGVYCSSSNKLIEVRSCGAHEAWARIRTMKHTYGAEALFIRFEDATLRTWIPKQSSEKAERGRAQGAGSVKRDSVLWREFCKLEGISFEAVAPKHNKTKTDAEYFKTITDWARQTNEHSRDGAMLSFHYRPILSSPPFRKT